MKKRKRQRTAWVYFEYNSFNVIGLVENDEKEQKEGSNADIEPPAASRGGQESFRGRKFTNFLNQNSN